MDRSRRTAAERDGARARRSLALARALWASTAVSVLGCLALDLGEVVARLQGQWERAFGLRFDPDVVPWGSNALAIPLVALGLVVPTFAFRLAFTRARERAARAATDSARPAAPYRSHGFGAPLDFVTPEAEIARHAAHYVGRLALSMAARALTVLLAQILCTHALDPCWATNLSWAANAAVLTAVAAIAVCADRPTRDRVFGCANAPRRI